MVHGRPLCTSSLDFAGKCATRTLNIVNDDKDQVTGYGLKQQLNLFNAASLKLHRQVQLKITYCCYQYDTELDVLHVARKDKKTIVMCLALHDCMHDRERMQIY